jgi:hypothetical protein
VRRLAGERYFLTDFRLVHSDGRLSDEIAVHDISEVTRTESRTDRILGTSTIVVHSRRPRPPLELASVRRGAQLAGALELLARDPDALPDRAALAAAIAWEPGSRVAHAEVLGALAAILIAISALVFGLRGRAIAVTFSSDDAIVPNGVKRSQAEIVQFMETQVMPWARQSIGRIKGGPDRVTCETCHGAGAEARGWQMPAVSALPQPDLRERGWELYSAGMDAQMRNAIYGYLAEPEKSAKAAFMREVVVPGMATLLHRPPYDFTRSYAYNRSRNALGCYHCHRVR